MGQSAQTDLMNCGDEDASCYATGLLCIVGRRHLAAGPLALGVPEETIIADYLLTNEAYERTAVEVDSLAANLGVSGEVMKVLMYASPSFIRAAIDEMTTMSGSVDTYLREQMGLTLETRARLQSELLY